MWIRASKYSTGIHKTDVTLLYSRSEACFARSTFGTGLGAKHVSNRDVWHRFEQGARCYNVRFLIYIMCDVLAINQKSHIIASRPFDLYKCDVLAGGELPVVHLAVAVHVKAHHQLFHLETAGQWGDAQELLDLFGIVSKLKLVQYYM